MILDPQRWLRWFDARGVEGPRIEFDGRLERMGSQQEDLVRWRAAMPPALEPHWEETRKPPWELDIAPLRAALRWSNSDEREQIQALYGWFGSGSGPWSGFPMYEAAAEELLLEYDIPALVDAAQAADLSAAQIEGAARLFGGWSFQKKCPGGPASLPTDLKARLWEAVKDSDNADKVGRARRAFNASPE